MIEYEEGDQAEKTLKSRSLSSKKNQEMIEKMKNAATKNAAAQAESEEMKAQAKKENAAAAGANCENAEAKTEEGERMCTGSMMNDSVVTANEAGGWHRGRIVLFTASEDEDHIAFHTDHFKHDMYDGPNEHGKIEEEPKRIESTSTETAPFVAVETAGETGDEHSDRSTANFEADRIEGEGHHARHLHSVRQQQQKRLKRLQKKDVEIGRLIEERRNTPKEEKQRLKEVSKCMKNVSETKKD